MSRSTKDFSIRPFIPIGKENAIHMPALAEKLGFGERKIRQLVFEQNMVDKAEEFPYVLIGNIHGYYYTDDITEIHKLNKTRSRGCNSSYRRIQSTQRDGFEGQMSFDFLGAEGT